MKLHLPKLLFSAIITLTIVAAQSTLAETITVNTYSNSNTMPSSDGSMVTYTGDLTLGTGEILGAYTAGGKLIDFSNYGTDSTYGKQLWTKPLFGSWSQSSSGNVSQNVNISGTLTINDTARVVLGGQYRTESTTSTNDEYTGIIANAVIVNGCGSSTNLETTNLTTNSLTVNSGTVSIHTSGNYKQGNTHFVVYDAEDSKQVSIRESLTINGGSTTIGHATGNNLQTAFGKLTYTDDTWFGDTLLSVKSAEIHSSQITQTAGRLNVQGDSVSVGGLNIEQTGGTMSISKGAYHDLADYGKSIIKQNATDAATVMNLGTIRAYNSQYNVIKDKLKENGVSVELKPSIDLTQSGVGTIHMEGVDFTAEIGASTEKSSIVQNGGGTINLNGSYLGATFDITQSDKGGTINLNGDMTADTVSQSGNSTINISSDGVLSANSITVGSGSTLDNQGFIIVSGAIVLKDGATLVNKGSISSSAFALMTADEQAAVVLSETEDLIILEEGSSFTNEGDVDKEIIVRGGTLTLTDAGYTQDITLESGTIYVTEKVQTGSLTLNGGTINFSEGASVELGESDVLNLSGTNIIISVADTNSIETGCIVTLFGSTGTVNGLDGTEITFTDENNGKVTGTLTDAGNGSFTVTVVPEPATATLSLLALAGLAMRRRRK